MGFEDVASRHIEQIVLDVLLGFLPELDSVMKDLKGDIEAAIAGLQVVLKVVIPKI